MFGDRVFFVHRGHRHWIRDGRWFSQNGASWPDSVLDVEPGLLLSFAPGGPAPLTWSDAEYESPPAELDSMSMREIAGSRCSGAGLEVGAGTSPFPLPLACKVLYGDRLPTGDLELELYPGQLREDLVEPDIEMDLDGLANVPDQSLDFIVACHVIEHTRNPIGALIQAWRRLKPGGRLVLVVPDMERTFDRGRAVTSLEHLIQDHLAPFRERDRGHYEEFYRVAFPMPPERYEATVRERFDSAYAIHYHAWTYASFRAMVDWVVENGAVFSSVWSHPARADRERDIEFYFSLIK